MKDKLIEIAERVNNMSEITENDIRAYYNYLGHYALIAAANIIY